MNLSPDRLKKLIIAAYPTLKKRKLRAVYHPRCKPCVIYMENGIGIRFDRGPFGYEFADGSRYPEAT